jgi:hypothetical protein
MSRRVEFLRDFLGAFGAKEVRFSEVNDETVRGRVIYDPNDPEEFQDFCWHAREFDVPVPEVCKLVRIIRQKQLLDIDKLRVSRSELQRLYAQEHGNAGSNVDLDEAVDQLEEVEVKMMDDGIETDAYFIHE